MKLRIISKSGRVPRYETPLSAGFDVPAWLPDGPVTLAPGERYLVPTGIFMELPDGYEAQVRARSGLAVKHGIGLVNGVGTIDADYRGEVKIALINWGREDFTIKDGDRVAQIVINRFEQAEFETVEELTDTERGTGGFGHTGV